MVDSATHMTVAEEFYDGKPWADHSKDELIQGLKRISDVDVQQTSDEEFCRQILRVRKMDGSVLADDKVFMQNVPCGNTLLTAGSQRW